MMPVLHLLLYVTHLTSSGPISILYGVRNLRANWGYSVLLVRQLVAATREVSGDYATAGPAPVVNSIIRSLEISDSSDAGVMKMKREMLKSLREPYKHMESNEYYAIATLLDPGKHFLLHLQQRWQSKCLLL